MAVKSPFRIAITPENILADEPAMISEILDSGWDMVHLRHPGASLRDMRNLIEAIPQRHHGRLRLHGHFELLNSFKLGGIHLNRRCPHVPDNYNGPHSRSCHTIDEVRDSAGCDYVTLSPIFDSISKEGYKASFTEKELEGIDKTATSDVNMKVIALGGITPERVPQVMNLGFSGFAVLGALMTADSMDCFRQRLNAFNEVNTYNP